MAPKHFIFSLQVDIIIILCYYYKKRIKIGTMDMA